VTTCRPPVGEIPPAVPLAVAETAQAFAAAIDDLLGRDRAAGAAACRTFAAENTWEKRVRLMLALIDDIGRDSRPAP
jgi:hypothetical protein